MNIVHSRRRILRLTGAGACAAMLPAVDASAQEPPAVLRLLSGFPPGGTADAITRWLGEKLTGVLAKTALVDNKPGAGGRLAIESLKSMPSDGLTMLLTPSSTVTMYPYVYQKLSYDPLADLTPVSQVCDFVHALAVGPGVPSSVRTLPEFVVWCKANPDRASCGNSGDGSLPHFLTIMLSRNMGAKIEPIPYKGGGPALTDLLGGQIAALIAPEGTFTTYVAEGKLRLLATSGERRSRFFPTVGTFAEQGAKDLVVSEWYGMFMPAKTPSAQVDQAASAIAKVIKTDEIQARLTKVGLVGVGSSAAELGLRLRSDLNFWGPIVKSSGFTPLSA